MQRAKRDAAIVAFETLGIEGRNHSLAAYWLSLWRGDALPRRADFNPARVAKLLPGIGLFSVKPGVRSVCRLAGTAIVRGVGRDITGLDWQAYTPRHEWRLRLERNGAIALGQIGIGVRDIADAAGASRRSVELQLPFADEAEDGTRQILFHLDWREPEFSVRPNPDGTPRVADSFRAIPLG